VTKISQLSDIGANLAAGDEFIIRDVSDASTPNKKVTSSGFIDYVIAQGSVAGFTQIAAGVGPLSRVLASSSGTTGTLTFSTAAATTLIERARIDSSGNVGIGNSVPGYLLHLGGAAIATPNGQIALGIIAGTTPSARIDGYRVDGSFSGQLHFYTTSTGGTQTRAVTIDELQRVGIGTTSPGTSGEGAGLRVHSYLQRTEYYSPAGYYAGSFGYTNNTQDRVWLAVDSNYSQGSAVSAGIFLSSYHQDTGGGHCGHTIKDLRADGALVFSQVTTAASLGTAATETERARIDSSGRLLVGTSSDSGGALFQVNGDRIRVGTAKTPATSGATGTTGEIAWDADYIYVCTATNTWKRSAIATW
jgi:hypothetical protein